MGGELAVRLMRLVPEEGVRKQGRQGLGRVGVEPLPHEEGGVGGWESRRGSSVSADVERGCPSVEGT